MAFHRSVAPLTLQTAIVTASIGIAKLSGWLRRYFMVRVAPENCSEFQEGAVNGYSVFYANYTTLSPLYYRL